MSKVFPEAAGRDAEHSIARPATLPRAFRGTPAGFAAACRRILGPDLLLLLAMYAAAVVFCILFVRAERYFYFWDYISYQLRSEWLAFLLARDLPQAWATFLTTLSSDYNMIPSVPLAPLLMILGPGRTPYILSIVVVYLVPFALVTGAVASRLVESGRRRAFWVAAWLALALPATWAAVLRGYPDVGGGVLLGLALYLYLGDRTLARWRSVLWIGLLVGLAVVFRRHFAYAAVAELTVIGSGALIGRLQAGAAWPAALRLAASQGMALAIVAVGTLFAIAPAFAWRALTTDYTAVYASYEIPNAILATYYGGHYGWMILATGLAGLAWALARRDVDRGAVVVVLATAGLFALVWFGLARQVDPHYTYLFTTAVVAGLGLLARFLAFWPARVAFVLALVVNGIVCYAPSAMPTVAGALSSTAGRVNVFSGPVKPLRRSDYANMRTLTKELRRIAGPDRGILVAASSLVLNPDILMAADKEVRRPEEPPLRIVRSPQVDSRDGYPFQALIEADIVVVATPAQYHLLPQEQNVVGSLVDAFVAGRDFARNYRALPGAFALDQGVEARIFERTAAPSLEEALATLASLERDIDPPPGGEAYWAHLDGRTEILPPAQDERPILPTFRATVGATPSSVLYFGRLGAASRLRAQVRLGACGEVGRVRLSLVPLDRHGLASVERAISWDLGAEPALDLPFPDADAAYTVLQMKGEGLARPDATCEVRLERVAVE